MTAIPYLYQSNATDRDHRRSSYFLERESSDVGGTYAEEIRMATMIPMTAPSNSPEPEDIMDSTRSAGIESAQTDVGTQRVGVLSTHNSEETRAILNAVRVLGHEPVWIRDENVTSWIEDGTVQLSPRVDVFVNRMLPTTSDHQLEDLQPAALYEETTPVINPAQAVANTLHKYRAGVKLAEADLPVPDACFGRSPRTFDEWPEYLPDDAAHEHTVGTNRRQMSIVSPNEPVSPMFNDEHSFVQELLGETALLNPQTAAV